MSPDEIQDVKAQISQAESALDHYREAYALEISVSSPDPSDSSGMDPAGGTGAPEKSKSEAKKITAAELHAVINSNGDAVYIDNADGITLANQAALDQLGFASREELNRATHLRRGGEAGGVYCPPAAPSTFEFALGCRDVPNTR